MKRALINKNLKYLILLLILLNIPSISSLISIEKNPLKLYNIGEKIDISIRTGSDTGNIISVDLICDNYKLNYFKTPLNKEKDYYDIPSLTINQNFLGICKIKFTLLNENNAIEEISTNNFEITNILASDFYTDKENYFPGEKVLIEGKISRGVKLKVLLIDREKEIKSFNSILASDLFSVVLDLDENIPKGEKEILIYGEDKYGNKAQGSKKIKIAQVAKVLKINLDKVKVKPREEIKLISNIYDQSEEEMALNVEYSLLDPNGNLIESFVSNEKEIPLKFESQNPGEYVIKARYQNLGDIDKFSILEVREIDIKIDDGIINIKNIGNVKYVEHINVNAIVDGITYQIPIDINLDPDEVVFIDLRKELPSKNYDVTLSSDKQSYKLGNVKIDDDRPTVKKLSQVLSKMTGATVISTEKVGNVFYFVFVVVILGFFITFITYRKFKTKVTGVIEDTIKVQARNIGNLGQSLVKNQKEKNKIENMFGMYVDPNVLKADFSPNIRKKEISVLFTDIRGYSKIFDKADSEQIAKMLNIYFGKSSEIIKKNNGFINKFIGDSVMALFNAVIDDNNHLINSIKSALEIKKEMIMLNQKLKASGFEPIDVGIGVDSGISAVGNVGSKDKLEYTAVGIPVNIAFRLQSMSDGNVLITERVYQKIKDKINAIYVNETEMKNITGKINIYKVLGFKSSV